MALRGSSQSKNIDSNSADLLDVILEGKEQGYATSGTGKRILDEVDYWRKQAGWYDDDSVANSVNCKYYGCQYRRSDDYYQAYDDGYGYTKADDDGYDYTYSNDDTDDNDDNSNIHASTESESNGKFLGLDSDMLVTAAQIFGIVVGVIVFAMLVWIISRSSRVILNNKKVSNHKKRKVHGRPSSGESRTDERSRSRSRSGKNSRKNGRRAKDSSSDYELMDEKDGRSKSKSRSRKTRSSSKGRNQRKKPRSKSRGNTDR